MPGIDLDEIYRTLAPEDIPWNRPALPEPLVELLDGGVVSPCRAVEFGCGLGNHAIAMARRGFEVTGVDLSPTAVGMAREHAAAAGVRVRFLAADVTAELDELHGDFAFGWDWEMLHHLFPEQRLRYVTNLARLLAPGALHLSVCFSEHDPMFGSGKQRSTPIGTVLYFSSEKEIRELFETAFDIVTLGEIAIHGTHGDHRAVRALLRKPA
ncbi:MAG: class I SAM-dependent methyltransferase [Bacteroidia bacterium]|nr:class I SAM-dependent methyltransferase [Bacteroidia bacterium]